MTHCDLSGSDGYDMLMEVTRQSILYTAAELLSDWRQLDSAMDILRPGNAELRTQLRAILGGLAGVLVTGRDSLKD